MSLRKTCRLSCVERSLSIKPLSSMDWSVRFIWDFRIWVVLHRSVAVRGISGCCFWLLYRRLQIRASL